MTNRYMAGDWRYYFFNIEDKSINTAAVDISWENEDTNFSVFAIDPTGKIIQTNVPSGVFGYFQGWPSSDWLGPSAFSQGGGFFPVKNKDKTSTVLFTPINQTGTYSIMIHSTLFSGNNLTEPLSVSTRFTSVIQDDKEPEIILKLPEFIGKEEKIIPKIFDENLESVEIFLNGNYTDFSSGVLFEDQILLNLCRRCCRK